MNNHYFILNRVARQYSNGAISFIQYIIMFMFSYVAHSTYYILLLSRISTHVYTVANTTLIIPSVKTFGRNHRTELYRLFPQLLFVREALIITLQNGRAGMGWTVCMHALPRIFETDLTFKWEHNEILLCSAFVFSIITFLFLFFSLAHVY